MPVSLNHTQVPVVPLSCTPSLDQSFFCRMTLQTLYPISSTRPALCVCDFRIQIVLHHPPTSSLGLVETGASCYNFHSKFIFHKKYASSRFCFDVIVQYNISFIPNTPHFIVYHVTKQLSEISHEPSTVTTNPIYRRFAINVIVLHKMPL